MLGWFFFMLIHQTVSFWCESKSKMSTLASDWLRHFGFLFWSYCIPSHEKCWDCFPRGVLLLHREIQSPRWPPWYRMAVTFSICSPELLHANLPNVPEMFICFQEVLFVFRSILLLLSNLSNLSIPAEGYSSIPAEGYSRNACAHCYLRLYSIHVGWLGNELK